MPKNGLLSSKAKKTASFPLQELYILHTARSSLWGQKGASKSFQRKTAVQRETLCAKTNNQHHILWRMAVRPVEIFPSERMYGVIRGHELSLSCCHSPASWVESMQCKCETVKILCFNGNSSKCDSLFSLQPKDDHRAKLSSSKLKWPTTSRTTLH